MSCLPNYFTHTYDFVMVTALPLHLQNALDSNLRPYTIHNCLASVNYVVNRALIMGEKKKEQIYSSVSVVTIVWAGWPWHCGSVSLSTASYVVGSSVSSPGDSDSGMK